MTYICDLLAEWKQSGTSFILLGSQQQPICLHFFLVCPPQLLFRLSSTSQLSEMIKVKVKVNLEINVGSARKLTAWNGSQAYFQCSPRQVPLLRAREHFMFCTRQVLVVASLKSLAHAITF